jgi:carbon storage regulator CsrA
MLVLTRKYQEKIRIGENITITVLRTKGKAVRLGIEAPADVPVIRGELAFETGESDAAVTADDSCEPLPKPRLGACRPDATSSWQVDSPHERQTPHVEHNRLPRNEVRAFLPKLASGSAPLRAMISPRA